MSSTDTTTAITRKGVTFTFTRIAGVEVTAFDVVATVEGSTFVAPLGGFITGERASFAPAYSGQLEGEQIILPAWATTFMVADVLSAFAARIVEHLS